MTHEDETALERLEDRLRAILPARYQDCYEELQPISMGSAGLRYERDGKVAWEDMWGTFCNLAMAGGPPHKGSLLEPGSLQSIAASPDRYLEVATEICRGLGLVTDLTANPSSIPGWVGLDCDNDGMAGWLVRAIVMENVSARRQGATLLLPVGPDYRIEKEIKNVIAVSAKTTHYWIDHMPRCQQVDIADRFKAMEQETPLLEPVYGAEETDGQTLAAIMAASIHAATGLRRSSHNYQGWLGLECPDVAGAVWMMRSLVATNVLARREDTVLFVPVNPKTDPLGDRTVRALVQIHGFAAAKAIV